MLIFLAIVCILRQTSNAVPITDVASSPSPELIPPACQCPGPQRSLWDIIWSCLATTFACAWVTIHPNVPEPDEDWLWVGWRRLKAMFWALVAPELMFGWSVRQYAGAWVISEKYKPFNWTMVHGHFLQMGGFILYENGEPKQTLDEIEFQKRLEAGQIDFPSITAPEIMDRSKGDALSKGFALVQTIWFITQCISRRILHLALTELEITTLALATLNTMMYFCWRDKPLNVLCPVPVHLKQLNSAEKRVNSPGHHTSTSDIPPPASDGGTPFTVDKVPTTVIARSSAESLASKSLWSTSSNSDSERGGTHIRTAGAKAQRRACSQWMCCLWATSFFRPFRSVGGAAIDAIRESGAKQGWLKTVLRVLFVWPILDPVAALIGGVEKESRFRIPIFGGPTAVFELPKWVLILVVIAISISGAGFGTIHLLGWSFDFPSKFEQTIWRSGSLIISCEPVLFGSLVSIGAIIYNDEFQETLRTLPVIAKLVRWWQYSASAFRRWRELRTFHFHAFATLRHHAREWWCKSYMKKSLGRATDFAVMSFIGILFLATMAFYVLARVSLLILAIITLRNLPPSAYDTFEWATFIPHI